MRDCFLRLVCFFCLYILFGIAMLSYQPKDITQAFVYVVIIANAMVYAIRYINKEFYFLDEIMVIERDIIKALIEKKYERKYKEYIDDYNGDIDAKE